MKTKGRAGKATIPKIPPKPPSMAAGVSMAARVLNKITKSDMAMSKLEFVDADADQFILQNRVGLPNLSLQLGSILEDRNQSAASSMEMSELVKENEDDIRIRVDICDSTDNTEELDQHTIDKRFNRGKHADQEAPKTCTRIDLETIDSIEQELYNCISCNEGGKVLICNADLCPLAVHERCLGVSVTLDDKGNFYCPACSYNRARSEFLEANKNVEMTKKALCLFMRTGNGVGTVIEHQRLAEPSTVCSSENILHRDKVTTPANNALNAILTKEKLEKAKVLKMHESVSLTEHSQAKNNIECGISLVSGGDYAKVKDHQRRGPVEDQQQTEPVTCCSDKLPCTAEEENLDGETIRTFLSKQKQKNIMIVKENDCIRGREEHMQAHNNSACKTNKHLIKRDHVVVDKHQCRIPASLPREEPTIAFFGDAKENAENQNEERISSSKPRKKQGAAKRFSNPALPNSKRKKCIWSVQEEDMLKKGVQKFSSTEKKNIPWKSILEFGGNVFDSTRNPADLKDKWRSIGKKIGQEEDGGVT